PRFLDLRRGFCLSGDAQEPACGGRPALVRRGAGDPRRAHARLGRFLPEPVRLQRAAAGKVLRRAAQGHAAGEPLPQVLPAADRAAAGRRGDALGRGPGARRPRRTRRPRRGAHAEGARHRLCRPRRGAAQRQGRAHSGQPGRRELRTGEERPVNLDHFGMDTITLAGPLEGKLAAMRGAGFTHVMLNATDIAGHPGGEDAAFDAVRASGLRATGFQVLRDFEGLSGHLHAYKVDVAKAMLEMCRALGSRVLLVCSSASPHASGKFDDLVRDLRKLALLAVPLDIRIAYEALSWGLHVNLYTQAWEIVQAAERSNLGLAIDSFHILAHDSSLE